MAEKRTVLLALDGSLNAEYALNCKYKIALLIFWLVFHARSVGSIRGRQSAKDVTEIEKMRTSFVMFSDVDLWIIADLIWRFY